MRRFVVALGIIVIIALGVLSFAHRFSTLPPVPEPTPAVPAAATGPTVRLAGEVVRVEIADTPEKRMRGLSGHAPLGPAEGMLFVFPQEGHYPFWMKDMLFSIDMLWLDSNGRIVGMWLAAAPESYPHSYAPKAPARFVIELPAGFVRAHSIKIGDKAGL